MNKCHLVSLHKVQSLLQSNKAPFNVAHVFEFKVDEQGKLGLAHTGIQEKRAKFHARPGQDAVMLATQMIGTRRPRDGPEFDSWVKEIEEASDNERY